MKKRIFCLMGPTASGKTSLAVQLIQQFPFEIISVDSAMVYKGMNIGTAKPDAQTLKIAPHHLIDLVDPSVPYSAGQFREDALKAIGEVIAQHKVPLLVGGTMLYFRVLKYGLAKLPIANLRIREDLQNMASQDGWPSLHQRLKNVDEPAALRIHPHDSQRIQRALEVFLLTGRTMTAWQQEETENLTDYECHDFALMPDDRKNLQMKIAERFQEMLKAGFLEEAQMLYTRSDLTPDLPAMRTVGYKQMWDYLAHKITYDEMREQAITATRQLSKDK